MTGWWVVLCSIVIADWSWCTLIMNRWMQSYQCFLLTVWSRWMIVVVVMVSVACPSGTGRDAVSTHTSSSLSISVHESACEESLTHDSVSTCIFYMFWFPCWWCEVAAAGGLVLSGTHFNGGECFFVFWSDRWWGVAQGYKSIMSDVKSTDWAQGEHDVVYGVGGSCTSLGVVGCILTNVYNSVCSYIAMII